MKKKIILIIALLVGTFVINPAFAQMKIGHVNSAEILSQMDGVKKADADMQKYQTGLQSTYQSMVKEYESELTKYQSQAGMMEDYQKEVSEKKLMDLQKRIQETELSFQDKIAKERERLLSPILNQVEDAIKKVADANGYDYILDTSTGAVLHFKEANDISGLVKAELGIQ